MATRREIENLHRSLRTWYNTLGYRVTDTELKVVTKDTRNLDFWRHILKLVLPTDEIDEARSKLLSYKDYKEFKGLQADVERLERRKQELLEELSASRKKTGHLQTSMSSLKQKVCSDVLLRTNNMKTLDERSMREILQKSLVSHLSNIQTSFKEVCDDLDKFTASVLCHATKDTARLSTSSDECVRETNSILSKITSCMHNRIFSTPSDQHDKMKICDDVAKLQSQFRPRQILSAVVTISENAGKELRSITRTLDATSDLLDLKYDVVDDTLLNKDNTVFSVLQSDEQIHQLQQNSNQEWITTMQQNTKSKELCKAMKVLEKELSSEISKLPWTNEEKGGLIAFTRFLIRHKELSAKEKTFLAELENLRNLEQVANSNKLHTLKVQAKIKDFKSQSQDKQSLIKTLVRQTSSVETSLSMKTSIIKDFLNANLSKSGTFVDKTVDIISEYPNFLSNTIHKIPLDRILLSSSSVPVEDLSIYQFGNNINYSALLNDTDIPLNMSSESFLAVLSSIRRSQHENNFDQVLLNRIQSQCETAMPDSSIIFQTLLQVFQEFDVFASKNILDPLEKQSCKIRSSSNKIPSLKRMIEIFSNQPAQHLLPWIKVDGKTLAQFRGEAEDENVLSSLSNIHIGDQEDNDT